MDSEDAKREMDGQKIDDNIVEVVTATKKRPADPKGYYQDRRGGGYGRDRGGRDSYRDRDYRDRSRFELL